MKVVWHQGRFYLMPLFSAKWAANGNLENAIVFQMLAKPSREYLITKLS